MVQTGETDRVGLVACAKSKGRDPSPAKDLYQSTLFRGQRRAVEATCGQWYVISARHGLLHPDEVIAPYDETLVRTSVRRKRAWAQDVLAQIDQELGDLRGRVVEVHAGQDYYAHGLVTGLEARGATVEIPTEGLSFGEKLAYYAGTRPPAAPPPGTRSRLSARHPGRSDPTPVDPVSAPRGKYRPLHDHLAALDDARWDASFADVEDVLSDELPASARDHAAWWANETTTHSHARAWVAAGWRTQNVRLNAERVTFVRRAER